MARSCAAWTPPLSLALPAASEKKRHMADLKLIALDPEDLGIISAHLQDAVVRVGDMAFLPHEGRFAMILNRFDWAKAPSADRANSNSKDGAQRRRAGLRLDRVRSAKLQGLDLKDKRAVLSLLAVTYTGGPDDQSPEGDVTLTFSGGAAIRLGVECIEAELKDLGAAWAAQGVPQHPED